MRELTEIRKDIDAVDRQISELFEKRLEYTKEVAEYKIASGKPILDQEREAEKLKSLAASVSKKENSQAVCSLFEEIMKLSRMQQTELIAAQQEQKVETGGSL